MLSSGISTLAAQSMAVWDKSASPAFAAMQSAAEQGQYSFVFFWKENNDQTQRMYTELNNAAAKIPAVKVVPVSVIDPKEKKTVEHFGADRAPLPLTAAVAPNGAVTKAWPLQVRAGQLQEGIVSSGTAQCLKAMQDQKIVLLCVQNGKSHYGEASLAAAAGFKADTRFAAATEVVALDPADAREAAFLQSLQLNPKSVEAVTVILAPPGRPIARFVGAVTTDAIVAKVTSAQSGCCPGGQCGPNGCCPGGQCGPK
jgi:hypothetical protein